MWKIPEHDQKDMMKNELCSKGGKQFSTSSVKLKFCPLIFQLNRHFVWKYSPNSLIKIKVSKIKNPLLPLKTYDKTESFVLVILTEKNHSIVCFEEHKQILFTELSRWYTYTCNFIFFPTKCVCYK